MEMRVWPNFEFQVVALNDRFQCIQNRQPPGAVMISSLGRSSTMMPEGCPAKVPRLDASSMDT
jgi:hypothetical protein